MNEDTSTVTTKGQVTIPSKLRKALGLSPGKKVAFRLEDGKITLEPLKDDITAAFGLLKSRRGVSVDEMDEAIVQAVAERFSRHES
jgi:antitoxin PrlF